MRSSFYLIIPQQKTDPQRLAGFAEGPLGQWVAELPTANPSLATRLLQEMLLELIALEMPESKRLAALELLRPSFTLIEDFLRLKLIQSGFPKSETEQKIFSLLVSLQRQFTIGYWIVARDLTRREVGWTKSKATVLSIQRVIQGLSHIIISHYMMSEAIPDWIWIDLHSLYKLSEHLGKHNTTIAEAGSLFGGHSIADRYKQILLLSLAYPSGLMAKEFLQVYHFTEKVVDLVSIEAQPDTTQTLVCCVQTDDDLPPRFEHDALASAEKPHSSKVNATPNTGRYYLHLSKLHKLTKQTEKWASSEEVRFSGLERQHHSDSTSKLPAELFAYLMQRWQGIEPQGTLTFEDRMNRFVAIGLDATHELQNTHRQKMTIDLEHVAESYSERALSCQFQGEGLLSIGSLVSVRRIDALPQQRLLGVVCKILMSKHKNGLIFELSGIAQQSYSVSYRHSQADSQSELKHALLYGLKSPQGERSFIIVESFMIKDGDILQLFMGQQQFPIILIGRKNIGLGYWQFECRKIEPQQMQQIQKNKGYDFI